jgi:DNA polymerase III epsilon subunit-like protein
MELIFDLETSGLPIHISPETHKRKRGFPPPDDIQAYDSARIVSIAWIIIEPITKEIIQQEYYLVKPVDFSIPPEATAIHKITTEFATTNGTDIMQVYESFHKALKRVETILSYNIAFDYNVFKSSLIRHEQNDIIQELDAKQQKCIMLQAQRHINSRYYPKLSVMHQYVFNTPIQEAHNAMGDVMSCYKIYKQINS